MILTCIGIVVIIVMIDVLIGVHKVSKRDKETRLELKKKVMEKMVRDSAHMDKSNYEVLERQYELLGGCKEDLGIKKL